MATGPVEDPDHIPGLTPEQEALRAVVRDFAEREVAPHAGEWDRTGTFPLATVRAMGELGLFGIPFPEEYGGQGGDLTTLCLAIEELARHDQSIAITLSAGVGLGAGPIHRFGTEEQRQRWLPDLCAGRSLAAFGLTEPDGGSDAGAIRTRAVRDEETGEWVLDGEKAFITNSGTEITSVITVAARTAPGEISAFVVPVDTPGVEIQPPYRKLGWRASDTHGVTLSGVRVPADHVLGAPGRGLGAFLSVLDEGRVAIAALAAGCIRACLEDSVAYAGQRHAFGRPIGANQAVAFACSDLAVALDGARMLTYRAARLRDEGRPFRRAAAVAKLYATEAAVAATRTATQIHGGAGFMDDTPVARHYRDAKVLEIGEGTSEVQRLVIARTLGLPV